MTPQLPIWMMFLIVFTYLLLIALITAGFQKGLNIIHNTSHGSLVLWGMVSFLTAWLSIVIVLGVQGLFVTAPSEPAPRIAFGFVILLVGYGIFANFPTFHKVIASIPQQWMIGVQINRILGTLFLVGYFRGDLPGNFALPAGIGDILVSLTAVVVAYLFVTHHQQARSIGVIWNMAGILDLLIAVVMGVLTSPGPFHRLSLDAPNLTMSSFPFVIIPAFGVPVWLILHFISVRELLRTRV